VAKIILSIFLGGFNKYSHICVIECMFSILCIALFARQLFDTQRVARTKAVRGSEAEFGQRVHFWAQF
jgi:hypothetical protein